MLACGLDLMKCPIMLADWHSRSLQNAHHGGLFYFFSTTNFLSAYLLHAEQAGGAYKLYG